MKKTSFIPVIATSILFTIVLVINGGFSSGPDKQIPVTIGTALPDSVLKFLQNSCMDCHADDGNFFAKGKVNFSSWDKYSAEKQADKAKEICKELTKKSMPPAKWCKNNPDNVPTQANIEMVCRWTNSLQK